MNGGASHFVYAKCLTSAFEFMASNDLNDLAEHGRQKRKQLEQADREKTLHQSKREARKALVISKISLTPLGEYWPGGIFDWVGWIVLLFAVPFIFPFPKVMKFPIGFALIGFFFLMLAIARGLGELNYRREILWLKALPFPVEGYWESLGDVSERISAPNVSGKAIGFSLKLDFACAPSVALPDVLVGFDPKLKTEHKTDTEWKLSRTDFLGGASNYPLYRYLHRFIDQVAIKLHGQTPIERLAIRLDTMKNEMEDDRRYMDEVFRKDAEAVEKRHREEESRKA